MMERTSDRFFRKTIELKIEKQIVGRVFDWTTGSECKDIVKFPKFKKNTNSLGTRGVGATGTL
jgi:hypothetical protein